MVIKINKIINKNNLKKLKKSRVGNNKIKIKLLKNKIKLKIKRGNIIVNTKIRQIKKD